MNSNSTQSSVCHAASLLRQCLVAAGILLLAAGSPAFGQVSTINSVTIQTNLVGGLPDAVLTVTNNYPTVISFAYANAGTTNTAFSAEQDAWQFTFDGATNGYQFQSNDYYTATMSVTLTGDPASPRKEAGFAVEDINASISGQYILDTDSGEVVAFGGNLPFYASPLDHTFKSGDTITMGITILKDSAGKNAIIYSANGIDSPVLELTGNGVYLVSGSPAPYTLGGYFQIRGEGTGATNSGSAVFQNISVGTPLNIASQGVNGAVITWAATATNFLLQTSTNLTGTNWTTVLGQPVVGLAVPAPPPNSFYRLVAP